jgi:hypothetical protein
MKTKKKIKGLCAVAICIFFFSCNTDQTKIIKPPTEATKFPPVKNVKAALECVSKRRTFYFGEDIALAFKLSNHSDKKLVVYEWMRDTGANMRILYFICAKGGKAPADRASWQILSPEIHRPVARQTLELNKGNAVFIDKSIGADLLEKYCKTGNSLTLYAIGELNLQSLQMQSEVLCLEIKR